MSQAGTGKASEDRVAQALQAIMQLREETEVLARTYGVPEDAQAEDVPAAVVPDEPAADEAPEEAPEPATDEAVEDAPAEIPVEGAAQPHPRPTNRYDAALEVIHTEAIAGLRALAGHGFRAASSFLEVWRGETGQAIEQWRSRADDAVDEAVQGAEQTLESATADLASARARLSDLGG